MFAFGGKGWGHKNKGLYFFALYYFSSLSVEMR